MIKSDSFIKSVFKWFVSSFLLTIFIGTLILSFSWIMFILPIDFPGSVGEWITALASLFSGVLTLTGVIITINNQNKIRREDISIQYQPRFKAQYSDFFEKDSDHYIDSMSILTKDSLHNLSKETCNIEPKDMLYVCIVLSNIGRGEAISFTFSDMYFITKDRRKLSFHIDTTIIPSVYVFPNNNNKVNIRISVPLPQTWKDANINDAYNLCVDFSYFDIMKNDRILHVRCLGRLVRNPPNLRQYFFAENSQIFLEY